MKSETDFRSQLFIFRFQVLIGHSMLCLRLKHIAASAPVTRKAIRRMSTRTKLSKPITFVTGNQNKLREVSAILGDSIPIKSTAIDCTLPPPFLDSTS